MDAYHQSRIAQGENAHSDGDESTDGEDDAE